MLSDIDHVLAARDSGSGELTWIIAVLVLSLIGTIVGKLKEKTEKKDAPKRPRPVIRPPEPHERAEAPPARPARPPVLQAEPARHSGRRPPRPRPARPPRPKRVPVEKAPPALVIEPAPARRMSVPLDAATAHRPAPTRLAPQAKPPHHVHPAEERAQFSGLHEGTVPTTQVELQRTATPEVALTGPTVGRRARAGRLRVTRAGLRQAIVLKEILGPPVGIQPFDQQES